MRAWRGKTHTVLVLDDGFEHHGKRYTSLTQVASVLTGTHWSAGFQGILPLRWPTSLPQFGLATPMNFRMLASGRSSCRSPGPRPAVSLGTILGRPAASPPTSRATTWKNCATGEKRSAWRRFPCSKSSTRRQQNCCRCGDRWSFWRIVILKEAAVTDRSRFFFYGAMLFHK